MAQIHAARNDLQLKLNDTRRKNRIRPLLFHLLMMAGCFVAIRYLNNNASELRSSCSTLMYLSLRALPYVIALNSLSRIPGCLFPGKSNEEGVLQSGLEGEQQALSRLSRLGDDCHIFTNLRIPYQGREAETDLIVITPAGITIVEVKNSKGLITGDASDNELSQRKFMRNGDFHDKSFRNPFRQVGTHVYRLKGYLRDKGIQVPHIRTCAFFTNPEADLRITDREDILREKCPLFLAHESDLLMRYLLSSPAPLSATAARKSVHALEELRRAGLTQH